MTPHQALYDLAAAAAAELRHELREPDPLARTANHAAQLAADTIERFWLPALRPDPLDEH